MKIKINKTVPFSVLFSSKSGWGWNINHAGNKVIENLNGLVSYTQELARKFPMIAGHLEIRADGLSESESAKLPLVLPPIYRRCVSEVSVVDASIGQFELWPGKSFGEGLPQALMKSNSRSEYWGVFVESKNLYVVARYESDLVAVGKLGSEEEDKVFIIDISTSPVLRVFDVAKDFETFLLLAVNLMSLCSEFAEKQPEKGLIGMKDCTIKFNCSASQAQFWQGVAEQLMY